MEGPIYEPSSSRLFSILRNLILSTYGPLSIKNVDYVG